TVLEWQADFSEDPSLPEFDREPSPPHWEVRRLYRDVPGCVGVGIEADRNPTASGDGLPMEPFFLVLRPRGAESTFLPWRLDAMLVNSDAESAGNPCLAS